MKIIVLTNIKNIIIIKLPLLKPSIFTYHYKKQSLLNSFDSSKSSQILFRTKEYYDNNSNSNIIIIMKEYRL